MLNMFRQVLEMTDISVDAHRTRRNLCKTTFAEGDSTGLPGTKPVLHENERFSRTDSQQLIIKGINPLNLSQSIHRPHSTDFNETINK